MSKQQTYISKLLDNNNTMINFERWSDKRIQTIEKKLKKLYTKYYNLYKKDINKAEYIVIYEASDNNKQYEVKRIKIKDFLNLEGC
jgi:hypothetical protein